MTKNSVLRFCGIVLVVLGALALVAPLVAGTEPILPTTANVGAIGVGLALLIFCPKD